MQAEDEALFKTYDQNMFRVASWNLSRSKNPATWPVLHRLCELVDVLCAQLVSADTLHYLQSMPEVTRGDWKVFNSGIGHFRNVVVVTTSDCDEVNIYKAPMLMIPQDDICTVVVSRNGAIACFTSFYKGVFSVLQSLRHADGHATETGWISVYAGVADLSRASRQVRDEVSISKFCTGEKNAVFASQRFVSVAPLQKSTRHNFIVTNIVIKDTYAPHRR